MNRTYRVFGGPLCRLYISFINLDGDGTHYQVDRENNPAAFLAAHNNSFQSLHRAAAYANPASGTQIWMRFDSDITRQPGLQRFDLCIRQHGGLPVKRNQPHHSRQLQYPQPVLQRHSNKHVTGKQREVQFLTAVLPAPNRPVQRKKTLKAPALNLFGYALLVPRAGCQRVPVPLVRSW